MKKFQNNGHGLKFASSDIAGAWGLINKVTTITLLTHQRPDGDGMSACAALEYVLVGLGKKVETIYPDEPEFPIKRQPRDAKIKSHSRIPELLISLDTANCERMYFPEAFKNIPLINIDHHVSNSIRGTYNFVDGDASSACEVLFDLLMAWNIAIADKSLAEILLYGILYDSRVFHTQATSAHTLAVSAALVGCGADLYALKNELLCNKNPKIVSVWKVLLERITYAKRGDAVWSYIMQDDLKKLGVSISSLVGFNDFLGELSDIDITMLFYEMETGQTKVSLRSKSADVNKLAAKFGGGGHKNASGILSDTPLPELMSQVTAGF